MLYWASGYMLSPQEIQKVRQYLGKEDEGLAEVFKILSEPNRCKMFRSIAKNESLSVSDAAAILNISLPLASQHLKILHQGAFLTKTHKGRSTFYSLNHRNPVVQSILSAIE